MTNELQTQVVPQNLTAAEVRANVNLIQEVMKATMIDKQHYGIIPGCGNKPTLLKAGSEKILSTFRIAVEPVVEDMSGPDEARYRVICRGIHAPTGTFLGAGVGECSSNEKKYKWRKAINQEEFDATPEDRRQEAFTYEGRVKQVRTNIADIANTVLKMAKKRAQIDMTLTVTAASDIFTQDIEDMPKEILGDKTPAGKPNVSMPQEKAPANGAPATPATPGSMADKVQQMETMLAEMYPTDKEVKARILALTTWTAKEKDAKTGKVTEKVVKGVDTLRILKSEKQVDLLLGRVKAEYEEYKAATSDATGA